MSGPFDGIRSVSTALDTGSSVTLAKPAGAQTGDILTVFLLLSRSFPNLYIDAAEFEADDFENVYGTSGQPVIWQKFITGGDPSSWTWDITGEGIYGNGVLLYGVCWKPGTLLFNESYPNVSGPAWTVPVTGASGDITDDTVGYDETGYQASSSVSHTADVVAWLGTQDGTVSDGPYIAPTIASYSGDYNGGQYGTEYLLPNQVFGGGFQVSFRWGKMAHGTEAGGSFTYKLTHNADFTGDWPALVGYHGLGAAYQARLDIDPDLPPVAPETTSGHIEVHARKVDPGVPPYRLNNRMLGRGDDGPAR